MSKMIDALGFFFLSVILVEAVIYVGTLWFISYLSKKDKDDSTDNFHS
jgi:hypothetical protein